MRLSYWFPVAVVVIGVAALYNYALLTPLPANGYGRTIYDVHTILSIPPDSSLPILVGGEQEIPHGSLVVIVAGVLTDRPGSDFPEDAYFRLAYAGSILDEVVTGVFSLTLETPGATADTDNPQLFIRNDQSFPLEVDYRAFVIRPPTTWEKFSMFAGFVITAGLLAAVWPLYLVTIGRPNKRRTE